MIHDQSVQPRIAVKRFGLLGRDMCGNMRGGSHFSVILGNGELLGQGSRKMGKNEGISAMTDATKAHRFSILDDDPFAIDGLTRIINSSGAGSVLWTATAAQKALSLAMDTDHAPDMMLVDMALGPESRGLSGADVCYAIRRRTGKIRLLIVTSFPTQTYQREAISAGAQGIVGKSDWNVLRSAIVSVACGGTWGGGFETSSVAHLRVRKSVRTARRLLSIREQEALAFKSRGLTNKRISQSMGCKESTVNSLLARAKAKLHVRTAAEAVALWTGERS